MKHTDLIDGNTQISTRLRNVCIAIGINTIGELLDFPKQELLKYRNVGRRSILEIEEIRNTLT